MSRRQRFCLFVLLLMAWMVGWFFEQRAWFTGGLGILALVAALSQKRETGKWAVWRVLPWGVLLALLSISLINISHQSDPEGPKSTSPLGFRDTVGMINPAKPVEHLPWLPSTTDRIRTGTYLFTLTGILAFSLALVILPWGRREIRRFLNVLFVNAILLSMVGTWFYFVDPKLILGAYEPDGANPFATFHYKNTWAAFVIMPLAMAVGLASRHRTVRFDFFSRKNPVTPYLLLAPLLPLTLPLCESRAGLLLLTLLLGWFIVRMPYRWVKDRGTAQAISRPSLVSMGVSTILLIGVGMLTWRMAAPQFEELFEKSQRQLEETDEDGVAPDGRLLLMRDTARMAMAKPVFGWGLATFSQVFPAFEGLEMYKRIDLADDDFRWVPQYYEFAHCDWLQFWAEIGAVGLLLLIFPPIAWWVHCWRRGRRNDVSHWLGVGAVLILLLATFEFPFGSEPVALVFATCVALGGKYALLEEEDHQRRLRRRPRKPKTPPMNAAS